MKRNSLLLVAGLAVAAIASCGPSAAQIKADEAAKAARANAEPKPVVAPPVAAKPAPEPDPWEHAELFVAPTINPSTKVELGQVERFTLSSGLRVIVVPRHQVPDIAMSLAVLAGDGADPVDKTGLAEFTANMLRKGAGKRGADEIADAIDFVGGSLDTNVEDDASLVSCAVRTKDLRLCLDLVSSLVASPAFPEKEMSEVRDQLVSSVEQAHDTPGRLASEHAANLFFGDEDPRGRPMSKKSIAAIDRAALVEFHGKWYAPNNAVLAIAGDVDAKVVQAELEKAFSSWKRRDLPKMPEAKIVAADKLVVRLVDKSNATQSNIVIAGPGPSHRSPDWYAVALVNYVLGGGAFSSRLMKVVRSEGGKTYGASSSFTGTRDPGPFHVTTFTRNTETAPTLKLLFGEIEKMRANGPTDFELAGAKANLVGGYGLALESGHDVAGRLLSAETLGLDADYVAKFPERLAAVTRSDAAIVAGKYLAPSGLVVVGKAAEVAPQLEAAGWKPGQTIPSTAPVSAAERHDAEAAKAVAASATPAETDAGKKLLGEALAAVGPIATVENVVMKGSGMMSMQGHDLPVNVLIWRVPGKHAERLEIDMGGGAPRMTNIVADGKAVGKMGDHVMGEEDAPEDQVMLGSNIFALAWAAATPGVTVKALAPVEDGGKKYDVLQIAAAKGASVKLLLDPATHLIARAITETNGDKETQVFGDYKKFGGVQFPTHITVDAQGARTDFTFDDVKLNQTLPADLFKK